MNAYYNENDPYAAQWLRNLIAAGHIASGEVDERSIVEVRADDLRGFRQCHFFAGVGVWSYALRLASFPDDRPVWTGSCPCQPFSAAGKGEGTDDARHLWPHWFRLIGEHRPVAIFGEQVAAAIRHSWLDLVCADLEGLDYAVGAAVLGAHSVGAPHIRQRLYFVAESVDHPTSEGFSLRPSEAVFGGTACGIGERSSSDGRIVGDAEQPGLEGLTGHGDDGHRPGRLGADEARPTTAAGATDERLEHSESDGREQRRTESSGRSAESRRRSFWHNTDWLPCIDGKARPVEPGTFPLAHGAAARVGRLRAYGNAIVAPQAAAFVGAFLESRP